MPVVKKEISIAPDKTGAMYCSNVTVTHESAVKEEAGDEFDDYEAVQTVDDDQQEDYEPEGVSKNVIYKNIGTGSRPGPGPVVGHGHSELNPRPGGVKKKKVPIIKRDGGQGPRRVDYTYDVPRPVS